MTDTTPATPTTTTEPAAPPAPTMAGTFALYDRSDGAADLVLDVHVGPDTGIVRHRLPHWVAGYLLRGERPTPATLLRQITKGFGAPDAPATPE